MRLMPRDEQILTWINGFGFASADQIARYLHTQKPAAYRRLKKLVEGGFLIHEYVLHGHAGVYRLTKLGVQACGDELKALKEISLGIFRHDLALVDLALDLSESYNGEFIPHRRIRRELGLTGVGQIGHIADGYLTYSEAEKPVAIELELSLKGRARLHQIINHYGGDLSVGEVWYFSDEPHVRSAVERAAEGYSFIKTFALRDISSLNASERTRGRA
jgi:hypothetical protein